MTEFFARLKQRKLVQWAVAYVAFAFALIQVLDVVAGSYHWPDHAMHIVFGLLALGFVVMLVLAWYHGEKGRQRTSGAELLLIALVLAIGGGLLWRFGRGAQPTTTLAAANGPSAARSPDYAAGAASSGLQTSSFNPPADSIVVLPFANRSGEKSQQYFSDGITEELTGALGQNTGLSVIAWETASHYRDGTHTPAEIGKALNVAQILDGGIQRAGDEVRVSAELVSTVTGRQLWSSHYDATLKNIFAVQDQITGAIAGALKVKFAGMQAAPTLNPQAHDLYLKGLAALDRATAAQVQVAQNDFQQALQLDPNYADAWAALAYTYIRLSQISTLPLQEALPQARTAAEKALTFDPHNANALLELGNADVSDNRIAQAKSEYEQVLRLDPSNAHAHMDYGLVLPVRQSLAQTQEAARLDPDNVTPQMRLAQEYADLRNWPQAAAAAQRMVKLSPHNINGGFFLAFAYAQMQRDEEAVKAFDLVQPSTALDQQLVDAGRLTYQALLQPSLRPKALAALDKLRRADISPASQYDLLHLYAGLGAKVATLQMLPGFCAADPIYCDDLDINPVFAPLHGDPRFEKLSKRYTTITPQ